jgi:hypothetical protein
MTVPGRAPAIEVLPAPGGLTRVVVRLAVVQGEPFGDTTEGQLAQAARDLEGLLLEERGYSELSAEVLGAPGERCAVVTYSREVAGPPQAEAERAWLESSLDLVLPFEEDED